MAGPAVLRERLAEARIRREQTVIGARISATDRQIDYFLYVLNGLAEEKIALVDE